MVVDVCTVSSDELETSPKGIFIVTKTRTCPMKTILKLFLEWGIRFEKVYEIEEKFARKVAYADRRELEEEIIKRYIACEEDDEESKPNVASSQGGMSHMPVITKQQQESLRTD